MFSHVRGFSMASTGFLVRPYLTALRTQARNMMMVITAAMVCSMFNIVFTS
jgi:hypothetical protein